MNWTIELWLQEEIIKTGLQSGQNFEIKLTYELSFFYNNNNYYCADE
jgi:hypothetical protein